MRQKNHSDIVRSSLAACLLAPLAAHAAPAISSIKILTPTVNVNRPAASPLVEFVSSGHGTLIQLLWLGPSGEAVGQNFSDPHGFPATTTVRGYLPAQIGGTGIQTEFSPYTEAGKWTLATLSICDAQNNCSFYSATQFPPQTFTIINDGQQDILPPGFLGGAIETPTVSLSHDPVVRILVHATDNVSGIGAISVCITPPAVGVAQLCATTPPTLRPRLNATLQAELTLPSTTAPGVYTVQNVFLRDIADNFININNPGVIVGGFSAGDTITVTP